MYKRLIYFFCLLLTIINQNIAAKKYKYNLAVCAIFKNDAEWLEEWIDFHKRQGIQHFYLYNNNSTDNYLKVLERFIKSGDVEIINWPYNHENIIEWNKIQCDAYYHCTNKNKKACKWIAIIDTDEFLFSPINKNLNRVLKSYSKYAAVAVNWVTYGTSNCPKVPYKQLRKSLTYRSELANTVNLHVKSIVNPRYVTGCDSPHFCKYAKNKHAVTETKQRVEGPFSTKNSCNALRINHYTFRDLNFLHTVKIPRLSQWTNGKERALEEDKKLSLVYDPILVNR